VAVPVPAEFTAETVKFVEVRLTLGVPLITQVVALILSPEGSAGEMVQEVTPPPLLFSVVGVTVIKLPTTPLVPVALA
jgi:hypothetical protein